MLFARALQHVYVSDTPSRSIASGTIRAWYGACWSAFVLVFVTIGLSGGLGSALFGGSGAFVSGVVLWRSATLRLGWDDDGLTIRNALRTRFVPWSEVRGARSTGIGTQVVTVFKAAAIETSGGPITAEATACFKWRKPPRDTSAAAVEMVENELRRRRG